MAAQRIVLNHASVRALLKSPAMAADLKRRTDAVAAAAGPGMIAGVDKQWDRVRGYVVTGTNQAKVHEARDRALTRAIDAGRA